MGIIRMKITTTITIDPETHKWFKERRMVLSKVIDKCLTEYIRNEEEYQYYIKDWEEEIKDKDPDKFWR